MIQTKPQPRYSGHETFVCRYAWLPKVVGALSGKDNGALFKDEDEAMVRLGIGKNMVRSAKFWAEAAQIITDSPEGHRLTPFGERLLGREGHDQYFEQLETLWLIHWKIATNSKRPLYHWDQMLNHWHRSEFSESEAKIFLERGLPPEQAKRSKRTLSDGLRVFINSYVQAKGKKGEIGEDNLDCPLVELDLLRWSGDRINSDNQRESIYSFNIEDKPSISSELIAYCINDLWSSSHHRASSSLGFRIVSTEESSPGQVFKLPEASIRAHLDALSSVTRGAIVFEESQSMQQIWRRGNVSEMDLLDAIFADYQ
ncbi:DUF4007 family protein [Pelagicoccus sp. SDUM812003]|uniref:DUF4007 family protein n=1 Tax=Pelagicoccus sp. SDUM812003 TaxID=3041267 RepID=UPI00280EC27E|nr:DUF4007 family protein [Pelagicoccus sp. SDUM812003]MDQ8203338.1 DUF4007 family protein [Pelagicoccus sp. SDUM812003]